MLLFINPVEDSTFFCMQKVNDRIALFAYSSVTKLPRCEFHITFRSISPVITRARTPLDEFPLSETLFAPMDLAFVFLREPLLPSRAIALLDLVQIEIRAASYKKIQRSCYSVQKTRYT